MTLETWRCTINFTNIGAATDPSAASAFRLRGRMLISPFATVTFRTSFDSRLTGSCVNFTSTPANDLGYADPVPFLISGEY